MDPRSVTVVIPAFNEEGNLPPLITRIKELYPDYEVIVVDDGSSDKTAEAAREARANVYSHRRNLGNGAAIKTGIRNSKSEITLFMDADGQHDPAEIGKIVDALEKADMVVGARDFRSQASFFRLVANSIYNMLATYVTGQKISDLTSGFRAGKTEHIKKFIPLIPNTFSYPTTLVLGFIRSGYIVDFVDVTVRKRSGGKSKIKLVKDGTRFLLIIGKITTLYSPVRIFFPVGLFLLFCGLGNYTYTFLKWHRLTNMTVFLFTSAILVFLLGLISEQVSQLYFNRVED